MGKRGFTWFINLTIFGRL